MIINSLCQLVELYLVRIKSGCDQCITCKKKKKWILKKITLWIELSVSLTVLENIIKLSGRYPCSLPSFILKNAQLLRYQKETSSAFNQFFLPWV